MTPAQSTLLTPAVVAARLGVHIETLRRWAHAGEGPPFVAISGGQRTHRAYDSAALEAWIAARTCPGGPSTTDRRRRLPQAG